MEMGEQQYGLPDLRQLLAGKTHFPALPRVGEPFHGGRNLDTSHHYEMMMMGDALPHQRMDFLSESSSHSAFDEAGLWDGGNGRWPRQETLTLLEIRSRLDARFKEANQKGPLWDEVARIMAEEHGYHRSGKKCREKFENLYKYYKKTKEGKAGRQDGKHYRFFRQLEALYGENSNQNLETNHASNNKQCARVSNPCTTPANQEAFPVQKLSESLSLSNSSQFDSSSSEDAEKNSSTPACNENNSSFANKKDQKNLKRGRKSWKSKIREFIDLQMKKFLEIQEAWLDKMLTSLEKKEQERMLREEEWRKQVAERFEREQKLWANERAWVQARDIALMEALQRICGKELKVPSPEELTALDLHEDEDKEIENDSEMLESATNINKQWPEAEILSLMRLRSIMETRFQEGGYTKNALWEEISAKMSCLGYDRSAKRCKEKWEKTHKYLRKNKECNKKRKENSKTCPYFQHLESLYIHGGGINAHESDEQRPETLALQPSEGEGPSPSNSIAGSILNDHCLNFLMSDQGDNLWENYVMKINKGEQGL
ncbi:trihelix transcription factor PTL-like [Aristolochia californica]|uniref:trihelix transcription factor PTL-like n=1 Tax=Aristolochia californica TaxID=171875 RepID=UPI0035E15895